MTLAPGAGREPAKLQVPLKTLPLLKQGRSSVDWAGASQAEGPEFANALSY